MKIKLTMFFMLIGFYAYSQGKSPITYLLPKNVKAKVVEYISKDKKANQTYYAVLNTYADTTALLLCKLDSSFEKLVYLVNNTNRYIQISEATKVAVLLESDLKFSTNLHVLENPGKKNESITNTLINPSGYLLKFTGHYSDSKISYSGFFQY